MDWQEIEELMNESLPQCEELQVMDMGNNEDHSDQNEALQLPVGNFESREDLLNIVRDFVVMQGYAISIKKSKKDKFVIIGCDRGGSYRNRYGIPMENRKRKTASRLINCPFEV